MAEKAWQAWCNDETDCSDLEGVDKETLYRHFTAAMVQLAREHAERAVRSVMLQYVCEESRLPDYMGYVAEALREAEEK